MRITMWANDTDRSTWREWCAYATCRLLGHRPRQSRQDWYCERCGDVLPEGNMRRQP